MNDTSKVLLQWYKQNKYSFPWRKSKDSYCIWISEIMLQQTQVRTVIPYYKKWMKKFPSMMILSKSNLSEVLKIWEGLGYYKRAENIYQTSKIVMKKNHGQLPPAYNELINLPGIGDYTACAILSIAYDKKFAAIDGNLKRALTRLFLIKFENQNIKKFKKYGDILLSQKNPGYINQALMDLGREICKPNNPKCDICPINQFCKAYLLNVVTKYSVKKYKKNIPIYNVAVSMIFKNDKFLISKRPASGLLANLWELPGGKIIDGETKEECIVREIFEEINISVKKLIYIGSIKHQYSHFKVNITLFISVYNKGQYKAVSSQDIKWIAINEINNYTFPRATHKLFQLYEQYIQHYI